MERHGRFHRYMWIIRRKGGVGGGRSLSYGGHFAHLLCGSGCGCLGLTADFRSWA